MIITYNDYTSTETLYTEFYWNTAIQWQIRRNYIDYVQG
jgi:hypothetical protein